MQCSSSPLLAQQLLPPPSTASPALHVPHHSLSSRRCRLHRTAATLRQREEEEEEQQGRRTAALFLSRPCSSTDMPSSSSSDSSSSTLGARLVLERLYAGGDSGALAPYAPLQPLPLLYLPSVLTEQEQQQQQPQTEKTPSEQGYRGGTGAGGPGNGGNQNEFFANLGDALRTLRDDIPDLFNHDLNYNIYREDIVFRDPRNKFEGLKNYRIIFWSLRFHGKLFFRKLYVEVKRVWQPVNDRQTIKMRWTVHGIPRVPWEAEGLFDGISTYKLDSNGKIYEHMVDNVMLRDPPMALNSPLLATINLLRMPQQQPYPGIPTTYQGCADDCSTSTTTSTSVGSNNSVSLSSCDSLQQPELEGSTGSSFCSISSQDGASSSSSSLSSQCARFSWVRLYASLLGSLAVVQTLAGITHRGSDQRRDGSPPAALT
ncbi:hypothetical protein DUNSADRAFT_10496 [Dunaliella salina]|uniref:Uncharacterized protein n=1 Tax=Dunaliella salina TaxID=3046 RepID=A0ABQ7GF77_DUNSA|nr:hypothetical protein DUNSADRAFT_10496 [Dunaliella salina]|eukprot:KAF5833258.1 hypothetical protein DUNSADRAFT_10496 [Dunaliella salina]